MSAKRTRTSASGASSSGAISDSLIFNRLPGPFVAEANESVRLVLDGVTATFGGAFSRLGSGTLRVTTTRVVFHAGAKNDVGYIIQYPRISLHAVCRDDAAVPQPCLYCQVALLPDANADASSDECVTEDVYFAPSAASDLEGLFAAVTACAELWPDADMAKAGEDEEQLPPWFAGLERGAIGPFGDAAVSGQFQDAAE